MQDQAAKPPQAVSAQPAPMAPVTFSAQQAGSSPRAFYQALVAKREVLGDQMSRLLNRRDNVSQQLQNSPGIGAAERNALEQHLKELTTRIIDMEKQLHASDAEVAAAAGVPGAATTEQRSGRDTSFTGEDAAGIAVSFAGIAVVVLAVAYARRIWKGSMSAAVDFPASFAARFTRLEESLDTVALEVERVSEGQRYLTKVYADQGARAVGAGAAQPVEVKAAMGEPVRRN